MILDHALVAPGDEDEMLDAGLGLVDHVLDQRLVDDGQHLLRHRLGGGQDAVPRPATGKTALRIFMGCRGLGNMRIWERGKCFDCTLLSRFASQQRRMYGADCFASLALAGGDDEIPPC